MISKYKFFSYFFIGLVCLVILQFVSFILSKKEIFIYKNDKLLFFFSPPYIIIILFLVLIIFILFSLYEIKKEKDIPYINIPLGLILGGGLSNIFDRIRIGAVADYLDLYFWKMNLADIFIFIGILILFYQFIKSKKNT